MSKRSMSMNTFTPTATADAATALANGTYNGAIQGGSATQRINIIEVMLTGQAGASTPSIMLLARDSTVGVTLGATTTNDAPLDSAVAALAAPALVGNTWTTPPQRSTSAKLLNLAFNAFGGIVRWVAAPGEEIVQAGNTASVGETSLSAFTGGTTGLMGSHVIYEPF
jgi:hypothetical protein